MENSELAVSDLLGRVSALPDDNGRRAMARAQAVLSLFYTPAEPAEDDDELFDSIRDLLTDVMHLANQRGIDLDTCTDSAQRMVGYERQDWGMGLATVATTP